MKDTQNQTGGTPKATGHEIIQPEIVQSEITNELLGAESPSTEPVANPATDIELTPSEAVYAEYVAETERLISKAVNRNLLTVAEKQLGVDNIKAFLLTSLTFLAKGKSVLADGKVTIQEGMGTLTLLMMQMPQIKQIKFGQLYAEFKDLDKNELAEISAYLKEKGNANGLTDTNLILLAEATFQALGSIKIATDVWAEALRKK